MKVNLGIWGKLNRLVFILLGISGLIAIFIWYRPVIEQNQRMRQEVLRLQTERQKQEKQNRELEISIDALKKDPKTVERMAREKLGYARPGETVIYFEQNKKPTNLPSPPK